MVRIVFSIVVCFTLLSCTCCYSQKTQKSKQESAKKISSKPFIKVDTSVSKPDGGLTYDDLIKDLDVMLGMYNISSKNIISIEKNSRNVYDVKVQGENYAKRLTGQQIARLCEGLVDDVDFKKCVANAAQKTGLVFLRKESAFQWLAFSVSK